MRTYQLDTEGLPYEVPSSESWSGTRWTLQTFLRKNDIFVGKGRRPDPDVFVSTVFLVIDHSGKDSGAPILFETMISGGKHDGWKERYSTIDEAKLGHIMACSMALYDLEEW